MAQQPTIGPWPLLWRFPDVTVDAGKLSAPRPTPNLQPRGEGLCIYDSVIQIYPQVLGSSGPQRHHSPYSQ